MPTVGDIVIYNATANGGPTPPVTWNNWGVSPGVEGVDYYIIAGAGTNSFIQIEWLVANTYVITTTGYNLCGEMAGGSSDIIVEGVCISDWVDDGINYTCGNNIGEDPCKVYKGQIDGCGNTRWVFDYDEFTCGGCCSTDGITSSVINLDVSGGNLGIIYHYNNNNTHALNFDYSIGSFYGGLGVPIQTIPAGYNNGMGGTNPGAPMAYAFPLPFNLQVGSVVTVRYWLAPFNYISCYIDEVYTVIP